MMNVWNARPAGVGDTHGLRYHLLVAGGPPEVPVVFVHGVTSDPSEQFEALLARAVQGHASLIVPEFRRPQYAGYQRLAGADGPLAAAVAFEDVMLRAGDYMGRPIQKVDLVGFSGGAQFAHRYAMLYPRRIRRLIVVASGWYTWLDPARPFPYGARASRQSGDRAIGVDRFLGLPVHVLVGERDVHRDCHLRTTPRIDATQGPHRLARALRWADHLRTESSRRGLPPVVSVELLPGTGHSFHQAMRRGGLGTRIFGYLEGDVEPGAAHRNARSTERP
jgi:hypothetical protein